MKSSRLRLVGTLLVGLFIVLAVVDSASYAQRSRRGKTPESPVAISKDKQPWKFGPWVVGGALSAVAILVSLMNAKRTHLD